MSIINILSLATPQKNKKTKSLYTVDNVQLVNQDKKDFTGLEFQIQANTKNREKFINKNNINIHTKLIFWRKKENNVSIKHK